MHLGRTGMPSDVKRKLIETMRDSRCTDMSRRPQSRQQDKLTLTLIYSALTVLFGAAGATVMTRQVDHYSTCSSHRN